MATVNDLPRDPTAFPDNQVVVDGRHIGVDALVASPKLAVLSGLLSGAECDALIDAARTMMAPSLVIDERKVDNTAHDTRTSSGMHFPPGSSKIADEIQRRIMSVIGLPIDRAEPLQVLRYGPGEEYLPHFDFFDVDEPTATTGDGVSDDGDPLRTAGRDDDLLPLVGRIRRCHRVSGDRIRGPATARSGGVLHLLEAPMERSTTCRCTAAPRFTWGRSGSSRSGVANVRTAKAQLPRGRHRPVRLGSIPVLSIGRQRRGSVDQRVVSESVVEVTHELAPLAQVLEVRIGLALGHLAPRTLLEQDAHERGDGAVGQVLTASRMTSRRSS